MTSAHIYIGIMSGTSIDSVDVVAVTFHADRLNLLDTHSYPIPEGLRQSILTLSQANGDTVQLYGETDAALGILFAEATLAIMSKLFKMGYPSNSARSGLKLRQNALQTYIRTYVCVIL